MLEKALDGGAALQTTCQYKASIEVVSKLVKVGGKGLVMLEKNSDGQNALHATCHTKLQLKFFQS